MSTAREPLAIDPPPSSSPPEETLAAYLHPVAVASLGDSVASAARVMRDQRVGCLVVTRLSRPIGILTDRDLALRVVAEGRDGQTTCVGDVLTYDPLTLRDDDLVESAVRCMQEHGIRRLPIVDGEGRLRGIVTADDLVVQLGRRLSALGDAISESSDAEDSR